MMKSKLADMSVVAFIRILAGINTSHVIAEYRGHPGLLQRMKGYRVSVSMGLHFGWAIEGAIGSEFKFDASYLSPNVNIAVQIEGATKAYGVSLLLSEHVAEMSSAPVFATCRCLDRVVVAGSKQPMKIFA